MYLRRLVACLLATACGEPAAPSPPAASTEVPPQSVPTGVLLPLADSSGAREVQPTNPAGGVTWSFDSEPAGSRPKGFSFERTGSGSMGKWLTRAAADAPSGPNVLAQLDTDGTDGRFPMAVADEPSVADLSVTVKCKSVSGQVDQACGLVARYQDKANYYLTRANALEGNVRLYVVREGSRKQLASFDGPVKSDAWHELRIDVHRDELEVYWESKRVIQHKDATISKPGLVGVWTKADSVTYFDDLHVQPI